jgi:hypothetical protein
MKARIEHSIGVVKRVFGFAKVRDRGFNKNAHRLLVTYALAIRVSPTAGCCALRRPNAPERR